MTYIVEQKIKGKIYLYEVESYWDKDKKQPRQKRKYIGPKDGNRKASCNPKPSQLITRNYGNILLLNSVSEKLRIQEILKSLFPETFHEILALAYYEIMEGSAIDIFPYWVEEQHLLNTKKLYSSGISNLCEALGRSQAQRFEFIRKWIGCVEPLNGIYYDITSILSYSNNIEFIEWGDNRDKEDLPQLNIGIVFCKKSLLPVYYNIYPGSIADVTTLRNCVKYLKLLNINEILLILDRGFFCKSNILELHKEKITFIQPLPFKFKKVQELIKKRRKHINSPMNSFKYKEDVLFYLIDTLEFEGEFFDAHMYFNEKADVERRHNYLSSLLTIEEKLKDNQFNSLKEYITFKNSNIPEKYMEYFKWNLKTLKIEKNFRKISEYISSFGNIIFLTNQKDMDKKEVIDHYRRRDSIEKIFDELKNEMDGDRKRVHSNYSLEGRLFIKFIAMIIYMKISAVMDENNLFVKYTIRELLAEVKKLKITIVNGNKPIIAELTNKQKIIFESFGIDGKNTSA